MNYMNSEEQKKQFNEDFKKVPLDHLTVIVLIVITFIVITIIS